MYRLNLMGEHDLCKWAGLIIKAGLNVKSKLKYLPTKTTLEYHHALLASIIRWCLWAKCRYLILDMALLTHHPSWAPRANNIPKLDSISLRKLRAVFLTSCLKSVPKPCYHCGPNCLQILYGRTKHTHTHTGAAAVHSTNSSIHLNPDLHSI